MRARRDEWVRAGICARLKQIALEAYDRMAGLIRQELAIDWCITKARPAAANAPGAAPWTGGNRASNAPA